jgi:NADH-quinone oxidoreductase subunit G
VDNASESLLNAERPLIITGSGTLSESVICSAVNAANALNKKNKNLSLSFTFPDANSLGIMILGGKDPGLLKERNKELTIINLKTDLHKKYDEAFLDDFLNNKKLVAVDCLQNITTERSDVVIPAGTFAESDGTFVNSEGRAQRYYQVYKSENKDVMESWRVISKLYDKAGSESKSNYESILDEIAASIPELKEIKSIAPPPGFRIAGQKIPREPHRYSGRTSMHADVNVSEPKPPDDPDSALSFTMEGYRGQPPSPIIPSFWSPGWNSVQSINKYQIEVGGPLHGGDPGKRIFEKDDSANLKYFETKQNKFRRRENEYLAIPVYHIFGSEELSSVAEAVKKMIQEQFFWMNPDDAAKIGVKEDDLIQINNNDVSIKLPVKINLKIPEGMAGISVLANGKKIKFNQFINIKKTNG